MPLAPSVPQQWLLSSSGRSGLFAAHFGMGFSFAHFINPVAGPQAVTMYREHFQPSVNLQQPEAIAAFFVFCSEDEEKLRQQQAVTDYRFVQFEKVKFEPVAYEDVKDVSYTTMEQQRILANRPRMVIGNAEGVKEQLLALAAEYGIEEIMVANIALDYEDRITSYRLLARMFDLR